MSDNLKLLIERIKAGSQVDADWVTLSRALQAGRLTLVTGERAVAAGGNISDAIIQTGDGNVVIVLHGPDVAAIQEALQTRLPDQGLPLSSSVGFFVDPLPTFYVPRPEVLGPLKYELLRTDQIAAGVLGVTAIHGAGGMGKSTVAVALAHDLEVQKRFPDGVLWATLGQEPEILPLLGRWTKAVDGQSIQVPDLEMITTHLRNMLREKAVLLIVDDAWDAEHVRPFLIGGPKCHVLITTRRAKVVDEIKAHLYELDAMTPGQALALLSARLGRSLLSEETSEAEALANAMGYLPQSLELAAVRIARGVLWPDLRRSFEAEIVNLEALEDPNAVKDSTLTSEKRRRLSVRASLSLSLRALQSENHEAWQAFSWLGVIPEDAIVAAPMTATLWNASTDKASRLLECLWDHALLQQAGQIDINGQRWRGYHLHDIVHDMARHVLTAKPAARIIFWSRVPYGLGMDLRQANQVLLQRYLANTKNRLWHTLINDGYIHEHLAWHMERAGLGDAIHQLLCEETAERQNGWYTAREQLGQIAGYLEDVGRAWRLATAQVSAGDQHRHLARQIRYALVASSLASFSMPPGLLVAMLKGNQVNPQHALTLASLTPDAQERARSLAVLAEVLPTEQRQQALRGCLDILRATGLSSGYDVESLMCIFPLLSPDLHEAAFEIVRAGAGDESEALKTLAKEAPEAILGLVLAKTSHLEPQGLEDVLVHLARRVPEHMLDEVRQQMGRVPDTWRREEIWRILLVRLPMGDREDIVRDLLASQKTDDPYWRLPEAKLVPSTLHSELIAAAGAIPDPKGRAYALTWLIDDIAVNLRGTVVQGALLAARSIEDEKDKAQCLAFIGEHMAGDQGALVQTEALAVADSITYDLDRLHALLAIANHLSDTLRSEALDKALEKVRPGDYWYMERVVRLALPILHQPLDPERSQRILDWVMSNPSRAQRDELLSFLVNSIALDLRSDIVAGLLERYDGHTPDHNFFQRILPYVPDRMLERALDVALQLRRRANEDPLILLAERLPEHLLFKILTEVLPQEDVLFQRGYLWHVADRLSERLQRQALAIVAKMDQDWSRRSALEALAPHLPVSLLPEAKRVAECIGDRNMQIRAKVAYSHKLSRTSVSFLIDEVFALSEPELKARLLIRLADRLPPKAQTQILQQAFEAAENVSGLRGDKARMRVWIASHGSGRQQEAMVRKALEEIRQVWSFEGGDIAWAYRLLVPRLPDAGAEAELKRARADEKLGDADAIGAMAAYLPRLAGSQKQTLLQEIVSRADRIGDPEKRAEALVYVALHLPENERDAVIEQAMTAAQHTTSLKERLGILALSHRYAADEQRDELRTKMTQLLAFCPKEERADLLFETARYLPKDLQEQAVDHLGRERDLEHVPLDSRRPFAALMSQAFDSLTDDELGLTFVLACQRLSDSPNHTRDERFRSLMSSRFVSLPREALWRYWEEGLPYLASNRRYEVLDNLATLEPVVSKLAGEHGEAEVFKAIDDVTRWWP